MVSTKVADMEVGRGSREANMFRLACVEMREMEQPG